LFFSRHRGDETFNFLLYFKANGTNHPALYCDEFYVDKPHWISENYEERDGKEKNILGEDVNFKFQHKHNEAGILYLKKVQDRYLIKTKFPFRAITPGQVNMNYF
jgi:tRNA U34 2-thiouridine synthase MnmA/TrmU